MATMSDVLERQAISAQLAAIDGELKSISSRMYDFHRFPVDENEDPSVVIHTPVSAILNLADAVRELKEEVSETRKIIMERLNSDSSP